MGRHQRESAVSELTQPGLSTAALRKDQVGTDGAGPVDEETLERAITTGPHAADPDAVVVDAPVLVLSGRRDHWVGWERQERLGDRDLYPHATVVTVADAGHALPHERPGLVGALLGDWLERAGH